MPVKALGCAPRAFVAADVADARNRRKRLWIVDARPRGRPKRPGRHPRFRRMPRLPREGRAAIARLRQVSGRAARVGDRILVSGTTATHGEGEVVCPGDPVGQAVYIMDKIVASLSAQWKSVSRVHGHYLGHMHPANTLIEVSRLVGNYEIEIWAAAVVAPSQA